MIIQLTYGQLNKLAALFFNIAQALFILTFAVSYFATGIEVIDALKCATLGILFTYIGLELEKKREGVERK